MNIFYYNEAFNVQDGSSGHAFGLLNIFREHEKVSGVTTFPSLGKEQNQSPIRPGGHTKSAGFSVVEQLLRYGKRTAQSALRCRNLYPSLEEFVRNERSVQLARVGLFDSAPCRLAGKLKIPLVAEWNTPFFYEVGELRNGSMSSLCKHWERNFLRRSDLIYTVSNEVSRMLLDEYDLPEEKLLTVPNGYDPSIYPQDAVRFQQQREEVRERKKWRDKTVVAFIGSLKVWHGIENLLEIAQYFFGRDKTLHFVIIGDGEARSLVQDGTQRLDNLEWLGSLPPSVMAEYLVGCDLGIMPYASIENFYFSPLKLYDMIGAALPSIGFSAGQITEVYADCPEAGWGVQQSSPMDYIKIIEHLQRNKAEVAEKKELLIATRLKHTWCDRADRLIDAFMKISEDRRPFR